jgi:hypothetical protein
MALYSIAVDGIALGAATAKTVLELGVSANDRVALIAWWVEFDGATSTAIPVKVEAQRASAAVTTATTLTPEKWDAADAAASAVAKHSTSAEGAGTLNGGEIHRVHPQSGFFREYPLGRELVLGLSTFWRIRLTAAAAVNATVGAIWNEA